MADSGGGLPMMGATYGGGEESRLGYSSLFFIRNLGTGCHMVGGANPAGDRWGPERIFVELFDSVFLLSFVFF